MINYSIRNINYDDIFKIKIIRNEQIDVLRQTTLLKNEDQIKWYNEIILPSYKNKTKTLNFTILYDNEFIGYGGLVNIDYINKKAEISFLVEKKRAEQTNIYVNDFTYFLNFISKYAYENLGLHKLWTETYEFRKFHISILEKNNFIVEGILNDSIFFENKFIKSIIHGLILEKINFEETNNKDIINYQKYFNDKTVLVTGGAGLIGKDLIINLCKLSLKKIICIDLKEKPKIFDNLNIIYLQLDLNNLELDYAKELNPEIIFHLAATFERTTETIEFWEDSFINNVRASNHIGTICKNLKNLERVIFTSSYLIYNSDLYTFNEKQNNPIIINENTPIYPRNICGAAKLLHEIELKFLSHSNNCNFSVVTPRIYRVYGPGECGRLGGTIINRWINSLLQDESKTLNVFAKDGIFDYIYSEDVAFGLILLASSNHNGVINLGKGNGRKIEDVLNILKESFPKLNYNEIKSDIKYEACQASMDKFFEVTGWKPNTDLELGIKKCIEKIKNKHN